MKHLQCQERTGRRKYFVCGKPFAEEIEGHPMCRFHAAMRKRMRTNEQNRRNADRERAEQIALWEQRMKTAAARLGVRAQLGMVGLNYTESVSISLEDFERVVSR